MRSKITSLMMILPIALTNAVASAQVIRPAVPANLEVPAGHEPFLIVGAEGTQNYICLSSPAGFTWSFFGPQATLFLGSGQQVATHYLSPNAIDGAARATWQHSADSSTVWAAAIANSSDPSYVAPGSIPWLLLQVVGEQSGPTGGATLTETIYIQRVNTQGGIAPVTGCKSAKDVGKKMLVPYTTDYAFYK